MEKTFLMTFIQRLVNRLLKYHRVFSAVFVLLFVFSFFFIGWTNIQDDSTAFLPLDGQSRESLRLEEEEFVSFGTAEVVGENLSDSDAAHLAQTLASLENVAYSTREVSPSADGNGSSLYLYLSFDSLADTSDSLASVQQVQSIASAYSGVYVYSPLLDTSTASSQAQLRLVLQLTAVCVFLVLLLTTPSFGEIIVLLLCFAVSAVIQKGTDFVFGTISALSDTLSLPLQLMMTSVYFFFFSSRYWDARKTLDSQESVRMGLCAAAPEILTAAFTTAAGLVAMLFMNVAIGRELGLVLLKAVLISVLNVFLLMPTLMLLCGGLLDKTRHRRLLPVGLPLGKFAWFTRFIFPTVFLFALIVGVSMVDNINITYDSAAVSNHNRSSNEVAYEKLLKAGKANRIELIFPSGDYEKEQALVETLSAANGVEEVTSVAGIRVLDSFYLTDEVGYEDIMGITGMDEIASKAVLAMYAARNSEYETVLQDVSAYRAPFLDVLLCLHDNLHSTALNLNEEQIGAFEELYAHFDRICRELQGEEYSRIYIRLNLPMEGQTTEDTVVGIRQLANGIYGNNTCIGGRSVMSMEYRQAYGHDMNIAMAFSLVLILVILLVYYRSFSLPILLVIVTQGAVWIHMALTAYAGTATYFIVPMVVGCVLMGGNLDYAMALTNRYNEAKKITKDRRQAMTIALRSALPIAFASVAVTVCTGCMLSKGMGLGIATGTGLPLAMGAVISYVLLLLVLPQDLLLFDGLLERTSFDRMFAWSPQKAAKVRRNVVGWIMTAIGALSLLTAVVLWLASNNLREEKLNGYAGDIAAVDSLVSVAEEYETLSQELEDSTLDFAEHLLTDQIGSVWVNEGESALSLGKGTLEQKKSEYEKNSQQYEESLMQYEAGKAQYEEALANCDAAQAQYDAGVTAYEKAGTELHRIEAAYNEVIGPYNEYTKVQTEYDEAVSKGNVQKAAYLYMTVQTKKAAYDKAINASGYSISMLVAEYEASTHEYSQAEDNLAAAKQSLDDAKVQLEQGKAALEAGEAALAQTGVDLEKDYDKLQQDMQAYESDAQELDEARNQLDENSEVLARDIEKFSRANSLGTQLTTGIEAMYSFDAVRDQISRNANSTEILAQILVYCRDQIIATESRWNGLMASMTALFLSGLLTFLVGGLSLIKRRTRTQNNISVIASVSAGVALILWIIFGTEWFSLVIPLCAILLLLSAISIALYKSGKLE